VTDSRVEMAVIYFVRLQNGTKRREMAVNELAVFVAGDQFLFLWFGSIRFGAETYV